MPEKHGPQPIASCPPKTKSPGNPTVTTQESSEEKNACPAELSRDGRPTESFVTQPQVTDTNARKGPKKGTEIPTKFRCCCLFVSFCNTEANENKAKLEKKSLWEDQETQETSGREAATGCIQMSYIRI